MNTPNFSQFSHLLPLALAFALGNACVGVEYVKTDTADDSVVYGSLEFSQSAIAFGQALVGQTLTETLLITNEGDIPVELAGTELTDGNSVFSLDTATTFPATIAAGEEVVLSLTFAPSSVASYSGTFDVEVSDEAIGTVSVPLTGDGVNSIDTGTPDTGDGGSTGTGGVSVTPASLSFGTVDLGSSSTLSLELTNTGKDNFLLNNITSSDSQIEGSVDFNLPYVVSPGATKDIDIAYSPTSESTLSATITIETDKGNVDVPVSGDCEDLCDVCTPLISVSTGGSSAYSIDDFFAMSISGFNTDSRTITVQNIGDGEDPLEVTDVYVNNDSLFPGGTFTENYSGTSTLNTYDSVSFTIMFTVTDVTVEIADASTDTNILHIISNDPYQPDYQIQLGGIGM